MNPTTHVSQMLAFCHIWIWIFFFLFDEKHSKDSSLSPFFPPKSHFPAPSLEVTVIFPQTSLSS